MSEFNHGEGGYQHGALPNAPRMGRIAFEGCGGYGAQIRNVLPDAVISIAHLLYNDSRFLQLSASGGGIGLWRRIDNICEAYGIIDKTRQRDMYAQASDLVYSTDQPHGNSAELFDRRYVDLWSEDEESENNWHS